MCFSKFSQNKGFVFTLEALVSFILLVSFLGIASVEQLPKEDYLQRLELKQALNGAIAVLDENGFLLETLDRNGLSAGEKMDLVYEKATSLLPASYKVRIELADYNADKTACQASPTFSDCFEVKGLYPPRGPQLPPGKDVSHERLLLVKKQPAPQCEIGQVFSWKEKTRAEPASGSAFSKAGATKLLFAPYSDPLFFQEEDDFNAVLGVKITPSDEASCDQDIRVDLNISVPSYGRSPADIMLVMDRSGSMGEYTVNRGNISSGSFDDGTKIIEWGGCVAFGDWQTLGTFNVDANLVQNGFAIKMYYSGYSGDCGYPRMQLFRPDGSSTSVAGGSSPVTIEVDYPAQGTWTIKGWSDDTISYDLNYSITKMYAAKISAKEFVDYAEWHQPLDQLGLVSFDGSATLDQQLLVATTANKETVKGQIDTLIDDGGTAIGDGIIAATNELTGAGGNPEAMQFQVLLSDGKSNTGTNPITAAQSAADNNIKIYSIGLGSDADATTLTQVAQITGGEYYSAEEEEALSAVYTLIAIEIGSDLAGEPLEKAYDTNVMIPVKRCSDIVDAGSGECEDISDQNYMWYDIGYIDKNNLWEDYFIINIPCNVADACESDQRTFPADGTQIQYADENGVIKPPLPWDENITINFNYRDLTVRILRAVILGAIYMDVNSSNVGILDAGATSLHYYADDPYTGTLIRGQNIPSLVSGAFYIIYDDRVDYEGWLYVVINPAGNIRECPGNNIVELYCSGAAETQYFVLDIWAWR